MRKWMAAIPVVGCYSLSAAVFSKLPSASRPDLSPLVPFTLPAEESISRVTAALLLPTMALFVWCLLGYLSRVEGRQRTLPQWWLNEKTGSDAIRRFEPTYTTIVFAVTSVFALVHAALLGSMLEWPVWTFRIYTALAGLGMMAVGNVMPRTRPNWIVGVRTKRALSDPAIWFRTHRLLGAFMMITGGIVVLASVAAPRYALMIALTLLLCSFVAAYIGGTRTHVKDGDPPGI